MAANSFVKLVHVLHKDVPFAVVFFDGVAVQEIDAFKAASLIVIRLRAHLFSGLEEVEVMVANSAISWTDHTWNPWIGCTKISPACDHCFTAKAGGKELDGREWCERPNLLSRHAA